MKYLGIVLLLVITIGYCLYHIGESKAVTDLKSDEDAKLSTNTGIKWHDSLFKHLPKNLDTTIILLDLNHTPLRFSQYIKPVFNHEAIIYQDLGKWRLHRLTKESQDSLFKDAYAVASSERRIAYLTPDTIKNWKVKIANIAHTLARANYVLAIKSMRKLYLYKNGKPMRSFDMDLGWAPVGNKVFEGDGKTPEGVYHLDNKYYRKDRFYASIKLSYPNFEDRAIAKKRGVKAGYGILIHGTTAKKKNAKDWTAGCIALANNDMDTLFKYVGEGTIIEVRK